MKKVFVSSESEKSLVNAVKSNISALDNYKNIGLISTIQHASRLKKVKKYLESIGKKIYLHKGSSNCKYSGQILGCDVSSALKIEKKVDIFLYIGTGKFHPLGISIHTKKPVFFLNPFTKKMKRIRKKVIEEYKKKRIMAIMNVKEADNYGILVSIKPGQYNLKKAREVKKNLEKNNKRAFIFLFDTLNHSEFMNFNWVDAWINTACPRIIEDEFKKPVINVEELESIL